MKDFHIWADILTAIYRRTGDRPFTHAKISDILPPGHIIRYVSRGYFLRVRDSDGTLAQGVPGTGQLSGAGTPAQPISVGVPSRTRMPTTGGKT